jgi:GT2 family glycosyltransferase
MKKETVCAVVVTYNRKNLLIKCLEALRKQVKPIDAIYLIDNASMDGTPEMLLKEGYIKELAPEKLEEPWEKEFIIKNLVNGKNIRFHYVRMHQNIGGAGGFYEGIKRAHEKMYDWLWLMDDDGIPLNDCLYNLFKYASKNSVVGPLVINKDNPKETSCRFPISNGDGKEILTWNVDEIIKKYGQNGHYKGLCFYFDGILIPREIISDVGYPKKEMMIWGDETEYYLRVKNAGYDNITVISAKHLHPKDRQQNDDTPLGIFFSTDNDEYRFFIYSRNLGYISKKNSKFFGIPTFLKYVAYILFLKRDFKKLFIFVKAYVRGFLEIFN